MRASRYNHSSPITLLILSMVSYFEKALKVGLMVVFCILYFHTLNAQNPVLNFSTFIGGAGNNQPLGVGITPDRRIIVAGNFANVYGYTNRINLLRGSDSLSGRILIINATTGKLETVLNLGTEIYDFSMPPAPSNKAVVAGNFGVALLNLSDYSVTWDTQIVWRDMKVSIKESGDCAVLFSGNILHMDVVTGQMAHVGPNPYDVVNDIAILGDRIFVTGFNYVENNGGVYCGPNPGPNNKTLQIAFLDSYIYNIPEFYMTLEHRTWGFTADQMNCDLSITRGLRISAGPDEKLYFLGETYNAQNIFQYDGKTNYVLNGNKYPPLTNRVYDDYQSLARTGSSTLISYAAKIDPADGKVLSGQFITSRNDSLNDFYNVRNGAIAADAVGQTYIAGMAGNKIANRDFSTIGNSYISPYSGGDPTLLISTASNSRYLWQAFTGPNGKGTLTNVAVSSDLLVVLGQMEKGYVMTYNAPQNYPLNPSDSDGYTDAFLIVWNTQRVTQIGNTFSPIAPNITIKDKIVDFSEVNGIQQLQINNLQGKVIVSLTNPISSAFTMTAFPSGIYFIQISTKDQVVTKKIYLE